MSLVAPTLVELKPLSRISPSLGERLLACELSVAFRLDSRYDFLRRPAPASALGNVSHDLAERAARGDFDAIPDDALERELEDAWDVALASAERELAAAYPAAPPPASRWRGYAQTHVRMLDLLAAEVRRRRSGGTGGQTKLALEESLEPDGVPLHGRADRVERSSAGVDLVDLKTGWTLPPELKPAHRRQLLAYAFLWHAVHDEWPRTASVQRLDGERLTFEIDPGEAEAVAAELVGALDAYNARVATRPDPSELATPSADACAFCSYRVACRPFFLAVSVEWSWYRKNVIGRVKDVIAGRGVSRVEVAVEAGNVEVSQVSVINVPPALTPNRGDLIAVVDASPTRVSTDLRLAWDSAVCVWASSDLPLGQ